MSSKRKRMKETRKTHETGLKYLQKAGLNLLVVSSSGKLTFQPGSAFEDIKKETLPKPYVIKEKYTPREYKLDEELRKRYSIRTEVDLYRLMRICSIIITAFNGPEEQDTPKAHVKRLRDWIKENCFEDGVWVIYMALTSFEKQIGYRKELEIGLYFDLAHILGKFFKLWKNDPFHNPYKNIDPLNLDLS